MGCGKSHFLYSFIQHLKTHTNISDIAQNINILFAYNESSSIEKLKAAIEKCPLKIELKTSYQFPTLAELQEDTQLNDYHKIVILEGKLCIIICI